MSTYITVADLRIALRATISATDRTDHPTLECIHLHATGGRLLATATDRYVLSHARRKAEGELAPVLLHWHDCDLILRLLDGHDDKLMAVIGRVGNRPDSRLYVAIDDRRLVLRPGPIEGWPTGSLKRIEKLLADRTSCSLDQVMAVDPWNIERLLAAVRPLAERDRATYTYTPAGSTLRIYANGPEKPLRLEIGDWWVGVVMPITHRNTRYGEIPNVPIGVGGQA